MSLLHGSSICCLASGLFRANWFLGSCTNVFLDGPALSSGDEDAEEAAELPEVALEPAEPRTSQQVGPEEAAEPEPCPGQSHLHYTG